MMNAWKRVTAALIGTAMMMTALAGCGKDAQQDSGSEASSASPSTSAAVPSTKANDTTAQTGLAGKWTQGTGEEEAGTRMEATIDGSIITVNWVSPEMTALYWQGSYEAPQASGDYSWTSTGDTKAMKESLLASQDSTKKFTYTADTGTLSFTATMMDVETTVELTRE